MMGLREELGERAWRRFVGTAIHRSDVSPWTFRVEDGDGIGERVNEAADRSLILFERNQVRLKEWRRAYEERLRALAEWDQVEENVRKCLGVISQYKSASERYVWMDEETFSELEKSARQATEAKKVDEVQRALDLQEEGDRLAEAAKECLADPKDPSRRRKLEECEESWWRLRGKL